MRPQSLPHSTENAKIDSDINAAPLGIIDVGTSGNKFYSYLNKAAKNDHNAADICKMDRDCCSVHNVFETD